MFEHSTYTTAQKSSDRNGLLAKIKNSAAYLVPIIK
jgi:hypothetical protein